jgi:hypothetical protein
MVIVFFKVNTRMSLRKSARSGASSIIMPAHVKQVNFSASCQVGEGRQIFGMPIFQSAACLGKGLFPIFASA